MMSSPAIRLPQSNQQRGREQNALRTDAQPWGGQDAGWREGRQAIRRASLARPVSLQGNLRLPRSAAIGDIPPAKQHETTERAAQAAMRRCKQGARRSRLLTWEGTHGRPRPCVCCCPTAAPAEASYSPKQKGGCRMRSLQKRPRTVVAAGGMAQEVQAPMRLRTIEPLHPLCEEGCMVARVDRTARAERHGRTLRTATRLLASPVASTAEMRQIIAKAALAAAPGGE
jgi:hypothetical protein